jgi:DNA-binding CsgD family transcriptional regulator
MDQEVLNNGARENERRQQIVSALKGGIILADADGQIVWMDEKTRRRVNGELEDLSLPACRSDAKSVDCFVEPASLTINGELSTLCVIQESRDASRDLLAALEAVFADTASFTMTVIGKLRGLRQSAPTSSGDLDFLSARERDVLGLICQGRRDAEMSKHLKLSENTVRNHISSLYRKTGVNRRSAVIIWARERGITPEVLDDKRHRRS